MILGLFYCILTLTLLGRKSVIAKNHALFWVNYFVKHFVLVKEMTFCNYDFKLFFTD